MAQSSSGCYVVDQDFNIININQIAAEIYPQLKTGEKCYHCLMNYDSPCDVCPIVKGQKGPKLYQDPIRNITESVDVVDIEIPDYGLCHAIILSTVGTEADFAATLPTSADGLKYLALIKALADDYQNVFSVDLKDGFLTVYRHNGQYPDPSMLTRFNVNYSPSIAAYISGYVLETDQKMMREKTELKNLYRHLQTNDSLTIHYRVVLSGALHYYFLKIVRIGDPDSFTNALIGVACEDDEILSRKELQNAKRDLHAVEKDLITGLYTQEAFYVHGEELLRKYPDQDFDFCILQIQNFELILHQYGQFMENRLLALIGKLLKIYSADTTCIAYMGDGVFASLTPNTVTAIRRQDISAFRNKLISQSEIKSLFLKWSLYTKIQRDMSVAEIYLRTSYALSTIRGSIHQDLIEFDHSMLDRMSWEDYVEKGFDSFLANNEFVPWIQPQYSALTGQIVGAEALVRWIRPDGTVISPDRFIPVLERCGKIYQLDTCIFARICQLQKSMRENGYPQIPISVNLSRASIFPENIPHYYSSIAAEYGVDPRLIPLEITESAAIRASSIRTFANELIENGFVLEMDDFGSGYSSMANLQTIPFECIKIDKSLIDFCNTVKGRNLLKHTISFIHENGMTVVAEGVENELQLQILKELGCDTIQGFYFSMPISQSAFLETLTKKTVKGPMV